MVNNLKFCILIDNTSDKGLLPEHGFSVWIEGYGKTIFFDTGQNTDDSGILFKNARTMDRDLTAVDTLVISHGRYDHTETIRNFLTVNPKVNVTCHPSALKAERFRFYPHKVPRLIVMPEEGRNALQLRPHLQLQLLNNEKLLFSGVGFSGAIPRQYPLAINYKKINPDTFMTSPKISS